MFYIRITSAVSLIQSKISDKCRLGWNRQNRLKCSSKEYHHRNLFVVDYFVKIMIKKIVCTKCTILDPLYIIKSVTRIILRKKRFLTVFFLFTRENGTHEYKNRRTTINTNILIRLTLNLVSCEKMMI